MSLNVALNLAKNVGWNSLHGAGYMVGGGVVGIVVDTVARRILHPKPDSSLSRTITIAACLAGMATAAYFAPQAALVSFTAKQAIKLLALDATLATAMYLATKRCYPFPLITMGAMLGVFGTQALTAFGALGALSGSQIARASYDKRVRSQI